jgi:putative transposase
MIFHVLNRAAKRTVLFEDPHEYALFEQLLREALQRADVALFAYCIMPNHWHFLLTPRTDGALSRFMHWLTTTHARRWQEARGLAGLGAVYQGRYKAIPVSSDDHFLWVCRYVERNPLRSSLVTCAAQWRWSSLSHTGRGATWLADWPVTRPREWLSHVNTPQTQAELEAFRNAVQHDTPFGDENWKQEVLEILQVSPPRARGRPRKRRTSVL